MTVISVPTQLVLPLVLVLILKDIYVSSQLSELTPPLCSMSLILNHVCKYPAVVETICLTKQPNESLKTKDRSNVILGFIYSHCIKLFYDPKI